MCVRPLLCFLLILNVVFEHHEMNYYNLFVIIIPALFYILLQKALEINIKKVIIFLLSLEAVFL